ncbi:protein-methionine-sulfoxide reductase heme-binding subunit MsrQ [Photobacterium sp. TY1-4]|uniref:protein-methionine-sulfoxide reductase heme-binding subunit MsrQ n=1 Tax=Photobacterium sp. TY1-4 TaxID=2899122 RepID=UPI0021C00A2B|nr:protein-methionine-sulfoxide reductase heme-binding subunit MsrQ [Photobacterium sp. TY1-4]UXI03825.1 protein-methionine-sulfoxide reductase heme-binding subunit MsrQ [Photobacterium sp. TY1-4]
MKLTASHLTGLKVMIHLTSLAFVAILITRTLTEGFGADPVEGLSHFTGKAALNTLILTLLVSPIARKFRQGALIKVRRVLGLYSFFWAVLHLIVYLALDLGFDSSLLISEIITRPYLTLGAVCWLILLALAITSTQGMQRRLGPRWQKLHNWVYLAILLAPIHYYWSVKSGIIEPAFYIVTALILLSFRHKTLRRWLPGLPIRPTSTERS